CRFPNMGRTGVSMLPFFSKSRQTRRARGLRARLAVEQLEPRHMLDSTPSAIPWGGPSVVLQSFNGSTLPTNGDGDGYPNEMPLSTYGALSEGGSANLSLDSANAVSGNSLLANLLSGSNLYLQFNPYNSS